MPSTARKTTVRPSPPLGLRRPGESGEVDAALLEERRVAEADHPPLDRPAHAAAGRGGEAHDGGEGEAALLGRAHDRPRQRVLAPPLEARREAERLGVVLAVEAEDGGDASAGPR